MSPSSEKSTVYVKLDSPSGSASALISAHDGGRVASLVVDGMELLAPDTGAGPLAWGCYAMVPWAGRIRAGKFAFDGTTYNLPHNLGAHSIHGVGFERPWSVLGDARLGIELAAPWPFGGSATQSFALTDNTLSMTLVATAGSQAMPIVIGWHPCMRRVLTRGETAEVIFDPKWMWQRAADGVPDGTRVEPSPEPWDDTFGGVTTAPVIRWPGALRLSFETDCPAWIVYTERSDQVCVEPQTGIPNAFNFDNPDILGAGESMELLLTLRWSHDA